MTTDLLVRSRLRSDLNASRLKELVDSKLARRNEHRQLGNSTTIRSIIVPVDGTCFAEHAIPHAVALAKQLGGHIVLVSVHQPVQRAVRGRTLYVDEFWTASDKRQKEEYLANIVERISELSSVPVTSLLVKGRNVVERLLQATTSGVDLVVMATHGRGGLGRLWWGSVVDSFRRQTATPLLTVRGSDAPADFAAGRPIRRILVPLDGA